MSNRDVPHVVYCFDLGFRYCSVLSAFSVLEHRDGPTRISFFTGRPLDGLDDAVARLARRFPEADIALRTEPALDLDVELQNPLPAATYARLLLHRFVSGRIVYLDGDTLARRDIAPLYHADLQGKPFGAVRDSVIERDILYFTSRLFFKNTAHLFHIHTQPHHYDAARYFNSGVMVMDFARAAETGIADRLFDLDAALEFHRVNRTSFCDQDWLNHVARSHVHFLPPVWNAIWGNGDTAHPPLPRARRRAYALSRRDPAILHLAGAGKPWLGLPAWRRRQRRRKMRWYLEYRAAMQRMQRELGADLTQTLLD